MTLQEKIRILMVRRGNMSESELARRLGVFPQNLGRKMKLGRLSNAELERIAEVLGCSVTHTETIFTMLDTQERI